MTKAICVDDDATILTLVSNLLKANGYEVDTASNGKAGLEKIQAEKPDIVILDVMMPEMNGYDVCYQMRFDSSDFKDVPIILLTSRDQEIEEALAQEANIKYIQKPFEPQELMDTVKNLISKKGEEK